MIEQKAWAKPTTESPAASSRPSSSPCTRSRLSTLPTSASSSAAGSAAERSAGKNCGRGEAGETRAPVAQFREDQAGAALAAPRRRRQRLAQRVVGRAAAAAGEGGKGSRRVAHEKRGASGRREAQSLSVARSRRCELATPRSTEARVRRRRAKPAAPPLPAAPLPPAPARASSSLVGARAPAGVAAAGRCAPPMRSPSPCQEAARGAPAEEAGRAALLPPDAGRS